MKNMEVYDLPVPGVGIPSINCMNSRTAVRPRFVPLIFIYTNK